MVFPNLLIKNRSTIKTCCPLFQSMFFRRCKNTINNKQLVKNNRKENELNIEVKPLGEKIKETTKTTTYIGIILLGVGVTGSLFYAVFSELFSSKSPNNVYAKAAKECIEHPQVEDKLGYPISSHGHETRRGRRQHVFHINYIDNLGKKHMRMKFYLKGNFHTGTVYLDVVENDSGKYEYVYLIVEVDDMLRNSIVITDNRRNSAVTDLQL